LVPEIAHGRFLRDAQFRVWANCIITAICSYEVMRGTVLAIAAKRRLADAGFALR
jgi:hypothetical protein